MIAIPRLPIGNFASVLRMIAKVGGSAYLADTPSDLKNASSIILAGVGAFDHGMKSLQDGGWINELNELVLYRKRPVLGICLGMQLMCSSSEEGKMEGLKWIEAEVVRFSILPGSRIKVPHMGWNEINISQYNPLIRTEPSVPRYYFVHSYHVKCVNSNEVIATTRHGYDVTAAFRKENIFGVQFHPEKSHQFGMNLIRNFIDLSCLDTE